MVNDATSGAKTTSLNWKLSPNTDADNKTLDLNEGIWQIPSDSFSNFEPSSSTPSPLALAVNTNPNTNTNLDPFSSFNKFLEAFTDLDIMDTDTIEAFNKDLSPLLEDVFFNRAVDESQLDRALDALGLTPADKDKFVQWLKENISSQHKPKANLAVYSSKMDAAADKLFDFLDSNPKASFAEYVRALGDEDPVANLADFINAKVEHFLSKNPMGSYSDYVDQYQNDGYLPFPEDDFINAKVKNAKLILGNEIVKENGTALDFLDTVTGSFNDQPAYKEFNELLDKLRSSLDEAILEALNKPGFKSKLASAALNILEGKSQESEARTVVLEKLENLGLNFDETTDATKDKLITNLDSILNLETAAKIYEENAKAVEAQKSSNPAIPDLELEDMPLGTDLKEWSDYLTAIETKVRSNDKNVVNSILEKLNNLDKLDEVDLSNLEKVIGFSHRYKTDDQVEKVAEILKKALNKQIDDVNSGSVKPTSLTQAQQAKISASQMILPKLAGLKSGIEAEYDKRLQYARVFQQLAENPFEIDYAEDDVKAVVADLKAARVDIDTFASDEEKDIALRTFVKKLGEQFVDSTESNFQQGTPKRAEKRNVANLTQAIRTYLQNFPPAYRDGLLQDMNRFFTAQRLTEASRENLTDEDIALPLDFMTKGKGDPAIQKAMMESFLAQDPRIVNIGRLLDGGSSIEDIAKALPQILQRASSEGYGIHKGLLDLSRPMNSESTLNPINFNYQAHPVNPNMPVNKFVLDMGWNFITDPTDQADVKVKEASYNTSTKELKFSPDLEEIPDSMMELMKNLFGKSDLEVMEMINDPSFRQVIYNRSDKEKYEKLFEVYQDEIANGANPRTSKPPVVDVKPQVYFNQVNLMKLIVQGFKELEDEYAKGSSNPNFADIKARREKIQRLTEDNFEQPLYIEKKAPSVYSSEKYEEELRAFLYNLELYINHFNKNVAEPYFEHADKLMRQRRSQFGY